MSKYTVTLRCSDRDAEEVAQLIKQVSHLRKIPIDRFHMKLVIETYIDLLNCSASQLIELSSIEERPAPVEPSPAPVEKPKITAMDTGRLPARLLKKRIADIRVITSQSRVDLTHTAMVHLHEGYELGDFATAFCNDQLWYSFVMVKYEHIPADEEKEPNG